jgi:hypothetical protein
MYPVTVSICSALLGEAASLNSAELIDILWAHSLPADGLEHIGLRVGERTVDAVLFVKSATPESARGTAIEIFRRTLSLSRPLAEWKLVPDDGTGSRIEISRSVPGKPGTAC